MTIYLASPNSQVQAAAVCDMPVLLSFASYSPWIDRYQQSFRSILIDSGAYSEHQTGKKIDIMAYKDFIARFEPHADAIAGLDDISGNWQKSLKNYEIAGGFPTYHETDPPQLLPDLVEIARKCQWKWLGIGLLPNKRSGKEKWIRDTMDRIPTDIHVHGWALRAYSHVRRLDSMDSTNWWRDGFKLRSKSYLKHLTYSECLEIVVKRYKREHRMFNESKSEQLDLFAS